MYCNYTLERAFIAHFGSTKDTRDIPIDDFSLDHQVFKLILAYPSGDDSVNEDGKGELFLESVMKPDFCCLFAI